MLHGAGHNAALNHEDNNAILMGDGDVLQHYLLKNTYDNIFDISFGHKGQDDYVEAMKRRYAK